MALFNGVRAKGVHAQAALKRGTLLNARQPCHQFLHAYVPSPGLARPAAVLAKRRIPSVAFSISAEMADTSKPTLPVSYVVPAVWTFTPQEGRWGGSNRPTAGARTEEPLPVGEHPLQLYSLGTPNGMKVTILLEELGVEYDAWLINIMEQDQFKSGFVEINPNSKIPAMADHDFVPPLNIWESGHILKYLAEKYDKFIPKEPRERVECFNWLFWLQASAPFIGGGFGHFYKYAPLHIEYAVDRYTMETKRLLDVLDKHLEGRDFICNEYSIADMAIMPWILCIYKFYNAAEFLDYQSYKNVVAWVARIEERPAVQRGLRVNTFGPDAVTERHSPADFETKAE